MYRQTVNIQLNNSGPVMKPTHESIVSIVYNSFLLCQHLLSVHRQLARTVT